MSIQRIPSREQRARQACDAWNRSHPVGTPVVVELDNGSRFFTETSSLAWVSGYGFALVDINGWPKPCRLDQVNPLPLEDDHQLARLAKAAWALLWSISGATIPLEASHAEIALKRILREIYPGGERKP